MIYVLVQNYPSESNKYAMSYVHSRSLVYISNHLDFKVVSFSAKNNYSYEGVDILTKKEFEIQISNEHKDSLLISHAPNIKNHVPLIIKYKNKFKAIIMFFHGHEVLKISKYYPQPYSFNEKKSTIRITKDLYDYGKLKILKNLLKVLNKEKKLHLIFVSKWMKEQAEKNLDLNLNEFNNVKVINNNANIAFYENRFYDNSENKYADFITIRPLDDSKYCIDLINSLAYNNPNHSFHIYGKGNYFTHNNKSNNITVYNEFIEQKDIPELLNHYKCAIMPTRLDAQGVMMCEMATYGIPLITTDLDVCKEMLQEFKNVMLVDINTFSTLSLKSFKGNLYSDCRNEKFSDQNTVYKEIEIITEILES